MKISEPDEKKAINDPDKYEVFARQNLWGRLSVPGDKSATIRAILLGCFSEGVTVIENGLMCRDTESALRCVKALGAKVKILKNRMVITGAEEIKDGAVLDCGNSGTLARLLTGLLAGAGKNAVITGDESLKSRPMERVTEPLKKRGAKIETENGKLPVKIHPAKLKPFSYEMPVDSAQVKSAVLFSGLTSGETTVITEKNPTRDHTEAMLKYAGCDIETDGKTITLKKSRLKGTDIYIPGDPSSAGYYLALGLLLGEITVEDVLLSDTRLGFLKILYLAGGKFSVGKKIKKGCFVEADLTAHKSDIDYFEVKKEDIPSCVDELMLLAAVAAKNKGCVIHGACELELKESDRACGIKDLLNLAGYNCGYEGGDIKVYPGNSPERFVYSSPDHRMVMTAAVLMAAGKGGDILTPKSVDISFPGFFDNYGNMPLCLVGGDVKNSLSGFVHKEILSKLYKKSFTYECVSLPIESLEGFLKNPLYKAVSVTAPYKKEVLKYIGSGDRKAENCGAANYLLSDGNGTYKGYNTDGDGLLLFLEYKGESLRGKHVLIAGAGGAGLSIAAALTKAGAEVTVRNRTKEKAEEAAKKSGGKIKVYNKDDIPDGGYEILINATTLKKENPFSGEEMASCAFAADINYGGKKSAMLKDAKLLHKRCYDGTGMLFCQAFLSDMILLNLQKTPDIKGIFHKLLKSYLEKYTEKA